MSVTGRAFDQPATLIRSGIAPLDHSLGGGLAAARTHLLTGGIGTGKTTACLQFLDAGIQRGERCVLLTSDRGSDLRAHAAYAGVVLDPFLRDGRLTVLRYRPAFSTRFAHAVSPRAALDDLWRMVGDPPPGRLAIDPIVPFLGDGSPVGEGLAAVADFLEQLGVTALLTYPGDLSAGNDRRFDVLMNRAATVMHVQRGSHGIFRLDMVRQRGAAVATPAVQFSIRPSGGIVRVSEQPAATATANRRLTVLHAADTVSPEILELLQRDYEVSVTQLSPDFAKAGPALLESAAIIVESHHRSLELTRAFVRHAGAAADALPLIVVARFNLRSIDRARLLRAGADEVLGSDMSPSEFLQRLTSAVSRGHLRRPNVQYSERPLLQVDVGVGSMQPLDRQAFSAALAVHVAHDHPTQYTVVRLAPARDAWGTSDSSATLEELCEIVVRSARVASGDLIGIMDDRIAVYLHGARLSDAEPFVARVQAAWAARRYAPVEVDFSTYPSDEPQLRAFMEASQQS